VFQRNILCLLNSQEITVLDWKINKDYKRTNTTIIIIIIKMDITMYNFEDATCYLEAMLEQEKAYSSISCNYLLNMGYQRVKNDVMKDENEDNDCRSKMVDWCYKVVDFCKYNRETVSITMNYLDRFLATPKGSCLCSDIRTFQLACMTCLYTAIKVHEPEAMQPEAIAKLSQGLYSADEVEAMEFEIIGALEWRLNPPTPLSFLRVYLSFLPLELIETDDINTLFDLAKYQIELSTRDSFLTGLTASTVALAAVLNVFKLMEDEELPMMFLQGLSNVLEFRYNLRLVREAQERLWKALNSYHKDKLSHATFRNSAMPTTRERQVSMETSPRCVTSR
jgi:hypothetical protein